MLKSTPLRKARVIGPAPACDRFSGAPCRRCRAAQREHEQHAEQEYADGVVPVVERELPLLACPASFWVLAQEPQPSIVTTQNRIASPRLSTTNMRTPHQCQVVTGRYPRVTRCSTSPRSGTDVWAPARVTEMAAAALAKRSAEATGAPSASATANAPLNTSPAAVVSTAVTRNASAGSRDVPSDHSDPEAAELHHHRPGSQLD